MKQRETGSGRGCESPHLHQKHTLATRRPMGSSMKYVFDGGA